jgi:outer membrane immunogenic protein
VAFSCYTDLEGVWMAGGRVGFVAARNWLLYGTGGWASGNVGTRSQNNATAAVFDDFRVRKDGWFAGGGVEWMVASTPNVGVIVGVEYKHIDLGTVRMLSPGDGGVFGVDTRDVKTTADQVTLRASLKWNSLFGPVTARY